MYLLYSVIITMITLVAMGYREWALESISLEEEEKRKGENARVGNTS